MRILAIDPAEEWRIIPGFEAYEASSAGRIRRVRGGSPAAKPGRVLSQCRGSRGYFKVTLTMDGKERTALVHRLITLAFHGLPGSPELQAAHGDGNKENNLPGNLRWATPHENHDDKVRHGTQIRGSQVHCTRLTEAAVAEIRREYAQGHSQEALARKYGSSQSRVSAIVRRKTWRHV